MWEARIPTCWCDVMGPSSLIESARGVSCIRHGETHIPSWVKWPEKIAKKMLFDLHILCFVCIFVWHIYTRGKRRESVSGFLLGRSFSAMLRFLALLLVGLFSQSVSVTTGKICAFLKVTVISLCKFLKQLNQHP